MVNSFLSMIKGKGNSDEFFQFSRPENFKSWSKQQHYIGRASEVVN